MKKIDPVKLHQDAVKGLDDVYCAQRKSRDDAYRSRLFCDVRGAMWAGLWEEQFAKRPKFEINKVARACSRIYNEYRANRVTVDFAPISSSADDDVADVLDGMYRADERESNAQEAYDAAFNEGIKGGYGAFRIYNDYEDNSDEDNESQKVCFEPIHDADLTVFYDLNSKRYDKADSNRCWVLVPYTKDKFKEEFPDASPSSLSPPSGMNLNFVWVTADLIWVAEYYLREEHKVKVHVLHNENLDSTERLREDDYETIKELNAEIESLLSIGYKLQKVRKIEQYRVHKYYLSGSEILEDCGYIAGEYIPIIPYYGDRVVINGVEHCQGQVQKGIDSQILYNVQVSVIAETSALSQATKPIFHPEEIGAHGTTWASDNIENNPYLLRDPLSNIDGSPIYNTPIQYTQPRQIPPATAALLEITNRDIQDVTGNLEEAQQVASNMSGVAVQNVQDRLDMGVFGYMDNWAQSIRRAGEVWLSIRAAIETEARTVKTVEEDGTQGSIELNQPYVDEKTAQTILKNDIAKGRYKVVVDVAPSFATKRKAMLNNLISMFQYVSDPQLQSAMVNTAIQTMDGEGMQDLRKFARSNLVQMGVTEPNEEEKQAMAEAQQAQKPSPQDEYLIATAEKEKALAEKAKADTEKAMADADLTRSKTIETLEKIDASKLDRLLMLVDKLDGALQQIPQEQPMIQEQPIQPMEQTL